MTTAPAPVVEMPKRHAATPAKSGSLSRLFAPTVADCLFALVIFLTFLSSDKGWQKLFVDSDSGLHIRIGDLIRQSGSVPTTDPFAFSLPGQTWYAFEWGTEVLQSAIHQAWGLQGVALMTGVVLAAVFVTLFLSCLWRGANGGVAIFLTFFAVNASSIHFHARPHIFTMLFLAGAAWLLDRDRRRPDGFVWLLVPGTVLWANLHGAFPILFVLIGLLVVGLFLEGRVAHSLRFVGLGAACVAASLINPYGYHLHQHIVETMQAKWLIALVDEFKSPSFRSEQLLVYMAILFLGLGCLGRLLARRLYCEATVILFFAWASLTSVRHVPLFVLVTVPIVAVELTALWSAFAANLPRASVFRILDDLAAKVSAGHRHPSLWTAAFVAYLALVPGPVWPRDLSPELFPTRLVSRHPELAQARIFTSDQWSGYLIYRNFPRQKVFLDGRHNYYGEKIIGDMMKMRDAQLPARELLEHYRFDYAMLEPSMPLAMLLRLWPEWKLVDQDKQGLLFARLPR
ncbi:MAG: hypothetical protein K2X03_11925 [Bryobacteraceae bacterium]|nr:hypothetical protein [Bryobacteraceae bacterium]